MDKPFLKEGWKPVCKQDVVDLLMEVQMGNVSCRKASDILFPQLKPSVLEEKAKSLYVAYNGNVGSKCKGRGFPDWEDLDKDSKDFYYRILV